MRTRGLLNAVLEGGGLDAGNIVKGSGRWGRDVSLGGSFTHEPLDGADHAIDCVGARVCLLGEVGSPRARVAASTAASALPAKRR